MLSNSLSSFTMDTSLIYKDDIDHLETSISILGNENLQIKTDFKLLKKRLKEYEEKKEKELVDLKIHVKQLEKEIKDLQEEVNDFHKEKKFNKLIDNVRMSLSDIYYNKSKSIKQLLESMVDNDEIKECQITEIKTLGKIIEAYEHYKRNVNSKTIKVKQFIEIIIPNQIKWKLYLDLYVRLKEINKYRNSQYHKSNTEIKEILNNVKNMSKDDIKKLNIDDKLLNDVDSIINLIE